MQINSWINNSIYFNKYLISNWYCWVKFEFLNNTAVIRLCCNGFRLLILLTRSLVVQASSPLSYYFWVLDQGSRGAVLWLIYENNYAWLTKMFKCAEFADWWLQLFFLSRFWCNCNCNWCKLQLNIHYKRHSDCLINWVYQW